MAQMECDSPAPRESVEAAEEECLYSILGIQKDAAPKDVKKAYYKLVHKNQCYQAHLTPYSRL